MQQACIIILVCVSWQLVQAAPDIPQLPQHRSTEEPSSFFVTPTEVVRLRITEKSYGQFVKITTENSEAVVHGFKLSSSTAFNSTHYPPLKVGDIIPAFKGLYRVKKIEGELTDKVSLERLAVNDPALPEGTVVENLICHSFDKKFAGVLHGQSFISQFAPDPQGDSIIVQFEPNVIQKVKVGEYLVYGNSKFKLIRIVPPNKEKQIHGWFELGDAEAK